MKIQILGHDIEIAGELKDVDSDAIDSINNSILDGFESGSLKQGDRFHDWEFVPALSYLDEKISHLEDNHKVIFEHNQMLYEIYYSDSNEGYMYERYDMKDFINGDALNSDDGGLCTGSPYDAVYMAIAGVNGGE